ncbi:MAG: DUF2461 domain-containing protein [Fimbriimonas sp.]
MTYLSDDFFAFLSELRENNSREWFEANRKRYEKSVKKPFSSLVGELIGRIRADDPAVQIEAKDAIFRINRDTRFSKNKVPYKAYVYANISPFGTKNKAYPGFYMNLSPEQVYVGGGAYMLEPVEVLRVRQYIAGRLDEFGSLASAPSFVKLYGGVQGQTSKTVPAEIREAAAKQPLLFGKQFFYMAALEPSVALSEDLPDVLMDRYFAAKPMSVFLREALRSGS